MKVFCKKVLPYGFMVFIVTEFGNWLLDQVFDSVNLSFLCYILILAYVIYVGFFIHKEKFFNISVGIQWLLLVVIPICSLVLSLSYLWVRTPKGTILSLLQEEKNTFFLSLTFSFFLLVIWGTLLIVKQLINRSNYFAYSGTCIPIKENTKNDIMTVCLIKNDSHNTASWMFPGGHVNLQNSYLNEKNVVLSDISEIPEKIIKKKAEKEAGLIGLKLLSIESGFRAGMKQLNTCWNTASPVFTYLFKVNDEANCRKTYQHHVHFDFTYVGTYNSIDNPQYSILEFELNTKDLSQDTSTAIANITQRLSDEINKKMGNKSYVVSHQLFPDSIPEMIYSTYKYRELYNSLNQLKPQSS